MKFIFLLIVLFLLACLLYGIYAGISAIGRGAARIGGHQHRPANPDKPLKQRMSTNTAASTVLSRDYVAELQALFALHQNGALTLDEFQHFKQRLLTEVD